jgi:hypothetical protein
MGSSSPMVGGMATYGKAFSSGLLHQKFMTFIMMANNNVGNVLEFTIPVTIVKGQHLLNKTHQALVHLKLCLPSNFTSQMC